MLFGTCYTPLTTYYKSFNRLAAIVPPLEFSKLLSKDITRYRRAYKTTAKLLYGNGATICSNKHSEYG
jgi:hypothetical protein